MVPPINKLLGTLAVGEVNVPVSFMITVITGIENELHSGGSGEILGKCYLMVLSPYSLVIGPHCPD